MRTIIFEFPFNLGLSEPSPGHEPGVKKLPGWFSYFGFHTTLAPDEVHRLQPPPYAMLFDDESKVLNADELVSYARQEAALLKPLLQAGNKFPLVLGGDCSIGIGTALALKEQGNYALFYLDGHTDFINPEQSPRGGAGGMAAGIAAGLGHAKLTNIDQRGPYILPENLWCVGNREYDDAYEQTVRESAATYLTLDDLRQQGIDSCLASFLSAVTERELDGFWLHLDVDVLDDAVMPAVDSRTPGGLSYAELDIILQTLLSHPKAAGLEITILDPELDLEGVYTKEFVQQFCRSFTSARNKLNG